MAVYSDQLRKQLKYLSPKKQPLNQRKCLILWHDSYEDVLKLNLSNLDRMGNVMQHLNKHLNKFKKRD